jgi:ABC-2 type transport system ATP-binding protein
MRGLLLRLAESGKTLIVTSHILPDLARVCSVVAIITGGKLRAFGTVEEIMRRVNQRRRFEILLAESSQVSGAQQILETALGNGGADRTQVLAAEGVIRFDTDRTDARLAELLAHLVDRGVSVVQFREVPTDLEDAFLSVTRSENDAADAEIAADGRGERECSDEICRAP